MSELTIRLRIDPVTGKKEVVVDLQSDADALPIEHEQEHRRLVTDLLGGAKVAREGAQPQAEADAIEAPAEGIARRSG